MYNVCVCVCVRVRVLFLFYLVSPSGVTPKGGRECLMLTSCLESQGCHLIPLSYLLSFFLLLYLLLHGP